MGSDDVKNFMGHLWVLSEDGVVTVGLNEEALEDFDEIVSFDLPNENEKVTADEVCASIETSDGPIDIYSPVDGKVIEVNSAIVEDPALLMEDPYGEGWIIKIEGEEDLEDEDEDEDEEEEEEDEDYDDE